MSHMKSLSIRGILLLALFALFSFTAAQADTKMTPQDVVTLKQAGFTEAQIIEELKRRKMLGRFQLAPADVLSLRKQGLSMQLLQAMGIARSKDKTPKSKQRSPQPGQTPELGLSPQPGTPAPTPRTPEQSDTDTDKPAAFDLPAPSPHVLQWQALLRKPKMGVRAKAASALGRFGPAALVAVPDLLKALTQEGSVMFAAYLALNKIITNPLQVLDQLFQGLDSNHVIVQMVSAQHLGRLLFERQSLRASHPQLFARGLAAWGKRKGVADWIWTASLSDLAYYYLKRNRKTLALRALDYAVQRGFNDFYMFAKDATWKPLLELPAFQKIYQKMQMSPADRHEYFWLLSERQHVQHETKMMITENIGRKDSGNTQIYTTSIPTRPTNSFAVLALRWWLRWQQSQQRIMVLYSDISRRSHLLKMTIINNMGRSTYNQLYYRRMAALQSQRMALHRATQRRLAAQNRQYRHPAGLSTTPEPVPPLASLLQKQPTQR